MIETAAIVWAGVSGASGITALVLCRLAARKASDLEYKLWAKEKDCERWEGHARQAWAELETIKLQRHRSARHARKCQIDQYLARQRETTEKLKAGVGR